MLGRANEQELLGSLLSKTAEGHGGGVVIHGEPGIGKTALLACAEEQAVGFQVLRAVGVEPEADLAYATLHQLLLPGLAAVDQLPAPQAGALNILFGRAHGAPPDPFIVGLSTLSLLSLLAGEKPVLCVLDDAHWADQPTLRTLAFVARRLDNEPIALALAARADEGHSTDLPLLRRIPLMGLNPDAAKALLAERQLTDSEQNRLLTATGGNPLALLELAGTHLPPEGTQEPLAMTDELKRSFLTRIQALHKDSLPLLQLIAADGSGSVETIEKAAGSLRIDPDPLHRAELEELLTYDGPRLVFRHPLIRSAIYHSATADRRAVIHRALASAFDTPADQHRRAWHRAQAAVGPDEEAAEQLERSAEQAALRGGPAAAMAALTRAADLTADGPRRGRRLWTAARAAIRGGITSSAIELLDRAEREPELAEADRISVAVMRAIIAGFSGSPEDAMDLIRPWIPAALRIDAQRFTPTVAMYADLGVRTNQPQAWTDLRGWLDEAAPTEPALRLLQALCRARTGDEPGPVVVVEGLSDPITMTLAGAISRWLGAEEQGRRLCRDAGQLARTTGALGALAWNLEYQVADEIARGKFGLAEAYAEEGGQFAAEVGQPNTACRHRGLLALCAAIRGRAEAAELANSVLAEATGLQLADATACARRALGLIDLVAGRHQEAARHFEAAGAMPDLVEALVRAGDIAGATEATARFARWTEPIDSPALAALTARCQALAGDGDYTESLRLHALADAPLEFARTELLMGEQLRRDRRRSEAQHHLRTAAENFRRLGALAWADRAEGELRATGESARTPEAGALSTLTPQELRITLAVGEGLTNREIAAQLFLSPRTVDYHLRKVFQKAAITSRAELMRLVLTS
ncbi:AAA family ATPase [Actinocrispum sp. NPDC049592]|uniref:AAA family ATPase n=1 Tax=Actinocrispum sp. NPDC049592 TaxID=3154835 RepID=UPI00341B158A